MGVLYKKRLIVFFTIFDLFDHYWHFFSLRGGPIQKILIRKKLRWSKKWEGVGSQFFTPPLIVVVVVWWNTLDWINALNCSRVSAGHLTYTNIGRATDTSWNLWASNVSQQIPWGKFISAMDIWKKYCNILQLFWYFSLLCSWQRMVNRKWGRCTQL